MRLIFVARTDYENILTTKISRFTVCLTLMVSIVYLLNVGATPRETRQNFVAWINSLILGQSQKGTTSKDPSGMPIEGCYEGLTYSDVSKVTATLSTLHDWQSQCIQNGCSAGKLLTVTGNESKMTITQLQVGPFT